MGPQYISSSNSHDCIRFRYDFDQNILLSVIFSVSFLVGLVLVFAGYRFFRTSLLLQGFSIVSLVTYLLVSNFLQYTYAIDAAITVSVGIVLGVFGMFVTPVGLLLSSVIQTVFISTCIFYAVHVFTVITNVNLVTSIAVATFVLTSIPVLKWQRAVSVMYICSFGVILIMLAVDFFFNLSLLRVTAYQNALLLERTVYPCWFSWTLLGLWPLLMFVGCIVQFLKTAKEIDHTHDKYWYRRNREPQKVRLLSNKSDVISKVWMDEGSQSSFDKFLFHQHNLNILHVEETSDDDVFLMEGATAV